MEERHCFLKTISDQEGIVRKGTDCQVFHSFLKPEALVMAFWYRDVFFQQWQTDMMLDMQHTLETENQSSWQLRIDRLP